MAMEHALIKNGSIVRLVCTFFISFLKAIRAVASISSEKVNDGIVRASVIVLVIAFFIPVIFLTLHNGKVNRISMRMSGCMYRCLNISKANLLV